MLNLLKPITQPTESHQGPLHGLGGVWLCPRQVPGHWDTWILVQIPPQLITLGKSLVLSGTQFPQASHRQRAFQFSVYDW